MEGHDMEAMAAMEAPEACQAVAAPEMPGMEMSSEMKGMGAHQQALMDAMTATQMPMMQGIMAEDPDVAFACGMIPHHQGAIGMARVELEMGDDAEMQALAQKIIDDQMREIAQLTAFIEGHAQ